MTRFPTVFQMTWNFHTDIRKKKKKIGINFDNFSCDLQYFCQLSQLFYHQNFNFQQRISKPQNNLNNIFSYEYVSLKHFENRLKRIWFKDVFICLFFRFCYMCICDKSFEKCSNLLKLLLTIVIIFDHFIAKYWTFSWLINYRFRSIIYVVFLFIKS